MRVPSSYGPMTRAGDNTRRCVHSVGIGAKRSSRLLAACGLELGANGYRLAANGQGRIVQQDYLLRMIQELGGFVKGLLALRAGGRAEQAIIQIDDAIGRFS